MLRYYFDYFQILIGRATITHLTGHTHTLKNLCGIRACADSTRLSCAVILTVSTLAYTTKSVTLHNALETVTLRCTNNVNIFNALKYIGNGKRVA